MKSLGIFFSTIITAIILLAGCAKQTLVSKPYHNLTGRYNAYYNAQMRVMESFETLEKQYQDNYNKPLHLYPYIAVENADAVKQPLDEAITKCARNIKLHTIGNWTDDSYHLMGKAEFLQKEYERAANTFKYVVDKYHPENVEKELEALRKKKKKKKKKKRRKKKRRKKKSKKKSSKKKKPSKTDDDDEDKKKVRYGIKHRPVRYKSMLWLAKTYVELGNYDEAGYYLREMENNEHETYKLMPEVWAVTAHSWLKQKEYDKAVEPLLKAIEGTKKKEIKNRYVYVLAQIYQMQGQNQLAMENYHKIMRLKPTYEMEFNARLNMATNAANVTGKKPIDPEVALKRMLRDSKNKEYKDKIYFALARIKLNSGNKDEGILALQQSLQYSTDNTQRAEGCLMLAGLFYERDDFVKSYAYYDSTLQVMAKTDDRYTSTEINKRRLEGVATNMAIVEDKDSMKIVGSWDRAKQERWAVSGMQIDENAANAATAKAGKQPVKGGDFRTMQKGNSISALDEGLNRGSSRGGVQALPSGTVRIMDNELQKSKFPLYNNALKKKGERDFDKRWGQRAWADNWRRAEAADEIESDDTEIAAAEPKTQAEIDAYLKKKGVPMNDQEKVTLDKDLGEAIFKAAQHYREDLGRKDKALALVNRLVNDYPDNVYAVEALFLAYNIYSEENNVSKATYYKNEIIKKYPDSKIAKVLSDPEFANSEKAKYDAINQYYDDTYQLIRTGQASEALTRVRAVPTKFGTNYEMKARFALLEAMCIGGMKGETDYVKALRVIVTSFPDTKEEKEAKSMIAILTGKKGSKGNVRPNTPNKGGKGKTVPYKLDMKQQHVILIVFDDPKVKVNQYRVPVTTFNNKFYLSKRLSTSSILVDGKVPTLIVRTFPNGEEAMKYVVNAQSNKEFLSGVEGYKIYALSKTNYGLAMTSLKFDEYRAFFAENYR